MKSLFFTKTLNRRRLMQTAAGAALLFAAGALFFLAGHRTKLRAQALTLTQNLTRMESMAKAVQARGDRGFDMQTALTARAADFSLFTHLNHAIEVSGAKDKVAAINPAGQQETTDGLIRQDVVVRLEAATLEDGLRLAEAIEAPGQLVAVRRFELARPGQEQQLLNIRVEASTVSQKNHAP